MSNCNNCLPTSITWSPANNGTLNCTGTSASTVYTCFTNELIFYVDYDGVSLNNFIRQYDPSNGSNSFLTGATFNYMYGIANTNNKLWVQGNNFTSINEYTIAYSPITSGNTIIVTGPINKPIIGLNKLNSLVAISEDVLVGGGDFGGNKIIAYPVSGLTINSVELFTLPVADLDCTINDIKYDKNKQTLVITYCDTSLSKYYISEYTTGGTIVNEIEIPFVNDKQIISLTTFSGVNYMLSGGTLSTWTWYTYDNLTDLNLVSTSVSTNTGYQPSSSQALGVFRSPFTSTGASYCLSTNYVSTSQYDGNYYSGGTFDGYSLYVGDNGGVIYYNTGQTRWCLSSSIGGDCILFGGNRCSSTSPNLANEFFANNICPTPTPSSTNDCSVLDIQAYFDCDIAPPTPSITPSPTVTPTQNYVYPTPTPTMSPSPTASGNICGGVNFCFGVQNVAPSPSPTPTMTPSNAPGLNTDRSGVVTFTTINGEVVCPPAQII